LPLGLPHGGSEVRRPAGAGGRRLGAGAAPRWHRLLLARVPTPRPPPSPPLLLVPASCSVYSASAAPRRRPSLPDACRWSAPALLSCGKYGSGPGATPCCAIPSLSEMLVVRLDDVGAAVLCGEVPAPGEIRALSLCPSDHGDTPRRRGAWSFTSHLVQVRSPRKDLGLSESLMAAAPAGVAHLLGGVVSDPFLSWWR
jgi:hypothetical protein